MLRAVELDLKIFGVEFESDTRSVDTPEDLEFVKKNIPNDPYFKQYKHREIN